MKSKYAFRLILWLLISILAAPLVHAGEPAKNAPTPDPNPLTALNDRGISFPLTYTGEVLGDVSGGHRQGAVYEGLLQLGVQLDLEKLAGWKGGSALVSMIYPHGQSLTDRYVHAFNPVSSIDADHDIRLYEMWFQQNFDCDKFSIRIGQILADSDFYITPYGSVFMNSAFSAIPVVAGNFDAPTFPTAAPGVRIRYAPNDAFYTVFGVFAGDAGNQYTNNRHGTHFFDDNNGALFLGEIGYTFNPPPKSSDGDGKQQVAAGRPLSGTYKLGGFYNTGRFPDLSSGTEHRGDCAFYFIANQEIWHESADPCQGLGLFGQIGAAPDDRNVISFYCDGGINYQGLIPARDKDILGVGVSFTKISDNFLDGSGIPVPSHHETIVEATYQAPVNSWLTLQPDLQYIFNPGATARLPDALVVGLRFTISF